RHSDAREESDDQRSGDSDGRHHNEAGERHLGHGGLRIYNPYVANIIANTLRVGHHCRRTGETGRMRTHDLSIGDYALLSDCRSAALVSTGGSVDWLCFPRFDRPSIFGRLLDATAGHWSIRPVAHFETSRTYVDDTMLLETTFRTSTGSATLVDALAVGRNERGHELGSGATSTLVRSISGVEGEVERVLEFVTR